MSQSPFSSSAGKPGGNPPSAIDALLNDLISNARFVCLQTTACPPEIDSFYYREYQVAFVANALGAAIGIGEVFKRKDDQLTDVPLIDRIRAFEKAAGFLAAAGAGKMGFKAGTPSHQEFCARTLAAALAAAAAKGRFSKPASRPTG